MLKGKFCSATNFAKGQMLLREEFCLRTNFAKGKILLKGKGKVLLTWKIFPLRTNKFC